MAKRWRCYNPKCSPTALPGHAGVEFTSDKPECPSCHTTGVLIVPLADIHWLASGGGPLMTMEGPSRIPCQPSRKNIQGLHITAQPDAVTCPECKKAAGDEFERALAEFNEANGIYS